MSLETFPKNNEIIREYARLKKTFGEGESACMAVAKFQQKYIASSNLNDIKQYCEQNNIVYYTTLDILLEAYNKDIFTLSECDYFIYVLKLAKHKIPFSINSIEDLKGFIKR